MGTVAPAISRLLTVPRRRTWIGTKSSLLMKAYSRSRACCISRLLTLHCCWCFAAKFCLLTIQVCMHHLLLLLLLLIQLLLLLLLLLLKTRCCIRAANLTWLQGHQANDRVGNSHRLLL